jgi:hypothetical protein
MGLGESGRGEELKFCWRAVGKYYTMPSWNCPSARVTAMICPQPSLTEAATGSRSIFVLVKVMESETQQAVKRVKREAGFNPRIRNRGISVVVAWAGLLLLLQFGLSCRSIAPFPSVDLSEPGWQVRQGQAVWKLAKNKPELAGEITLARHADGRCLVEFAKTPFPLMRAKISASRWEIEFPPQKLHFSGGDQPPTRLAWLHLMRALTGKPVSPPWYFELRPNGGWRLENPRRGESVEGYLEP